MRERALTYRSSSSFAAEEGQDARALAEESTHLEFPTSTLGEVEGHMCPPWRGKKGRGVQKKREKEERRASTVGGTATWGADVGMCRQEETQKKRDVSPRASLRKGEKRGFPFRGKRTEIPPKLRAEKGEVGPERGSSASYSVKKRIGTEKNARESGATRSEGEKKSGSGTRER